MHLLYGPPISVTFGLIASAMLIIACGLVLWRKSTRKSAKLLISAVIFGVCGLLLLGLTVYLIMSYLTYLPGGEDTRFPSGWAVIGLVALVCVAIVALVWFILMRDAVAIFCLVFMIGASFAVLSDTAMLYGQGEQWSSAINYTLTFLAGVGWTGCAMAMIGAYFAAFIDFKYDTLPIGEERSRQTELPPTADESEADELNAADPATRPSSDDTTARQHVPAS